MPLGIRRELWSVWIAETIVDTERNIFKLKVAVVMLQRKVKLFQSDMVYMYRERKCKGSKRNYSHKDLQ